MRILGIDPGPESSGWAFFEASPGGDNFKLIGAGDDNNDEVRKKLFQINELFALVPDLIAIEKPTLIGQMNIQETVILTAIEFGKFHADFSPVAKVLGIHRRDVLRQLFGTHVLKNADQHIREYLRQELGDTGSPKNQGPLYKMRGLKHCWQALAAGLAVLLRDYPT